MSFGFSKGRFVVLCLASNCLAANLACAQGLAQPRRSIELTETNSAEILTNLDLLATKKDVSRQIEDQLRAFKGLSSPGPMNERLSMPYSAPSVLPNKKLKELLEQKRNWGFSADQLSPGSSDLDILARFGDDKAGNKDSLQQFYQTLMQPTGASPGQKSARDSSGQKRNQDSFENNNPDDDSSLPPGVRAMTKGLKEAVQQDPSGIFNPTRPRSSWENFFGGNASAAPEPEASAPVKPTGESFLEQYKKGLDFTTALGLSPALGALVSPGTPSPKVYSPDLTKLPLTPHKDEPQRNAVTANSVPDPTSLSDLNNTVLNAWNPLYTPSKLELPKYAPPTPPDLQFPRRRF